MVVNGNIADHVSSVVHKLLDRCRSFVVASRPSVSLEEREDCEKYRILHGWRMQSICDTDVAS